jgi:two-component system, NarL family, response regulator NreC
MYNIRVVMADDHEIFRDGFKLMLSKNKDIQLVAEAENGRELVELVSLHSPDVVVTDIKMPIMDGIEATRVIKAKFPAISIIGLSMFDEDDLIIEMLDAGALGYLLKNADKDEVAAAIQAVFRGDHYYCRSTHAKMMQLIAKSRYNPYSKKEKITFTEKETEVIQLICQEYTNKEIADKLNASVRTVEGYRLRILERMQVKNTVGLVVYAIKHGIFDPNVVGK